MEIIKYNYSPSTRALLLIDSRDERMLAPPGGSMHAKIYISGGGTEEITVAVK